MFRIQLQLHSLVFCSLFGLACDPGAFRSDVSASTRKDASVAGRDAGRPDAGAEPAKTGGRTSQPMTGRGGAGGEGARMAPSAGAAAGGKGGTSAAAGAGGSVTGGAAAAGDASAGAAADSCSRPDKDAPVQLVSMQEIGSVMQPAPVALRVPGQITWIGGSKLVWLFPKSTLSPQPMAAGAPPNFPSAAFVTRKEPTKLDERSVAGAPLSFSMADAEHPALELWPTALLHVISKDTMSAAGGVAILQRIAADFSYDVLSAPLNIDALATQGPMTPLFSGDDPKFSIGGFSGGTYGYLYACTGDDSVADRGDPKHYPCRVARADLTQLGKRESWQTYRPSDQQWLSELSAGEPVIYGPSNMLSVSHNTPLDRYLAVYSRWFSNDIIVQSAAHPMGPWRTELTITVPPPPEGVAQFAQEQPSLKESECDTSIWITYMAPRAMNAGFPSEAEIKLLRVELK